MSVLIKQATALNKAGELSSELVELLEGIGVELVEEIGEADIDYVLVRDHVGSFHGLVESLEIGEKDIPLISLSPVENKFDFISAYGRAWINEKLLSDPISNVLVKRFFEQNSSLQLEFVLGERVRELKSCKLTGHLSVGHYTDLVAKEAIENGFDVVSIRNYFVGIVSYLSYLNKGGIASFPFEVDFGAGEDAFTIQIHADVRNFVIEYLFESFSNVGGQHPFRYLLEMSTKLANFFDVYYLENASKIVITGVWFREDFLAKGDYFSTIQINEIESFSRLRDRWSSYVSRPQVVLESAKKDIIRKLEASRLPGDYAELLVPGKQNYLSRYPVLLKQLVEFVVSVRAGEEFPKPMESLIPDDVLQYLCTHPNVEMIQKLETTDLEAIIKGLLKPELIDSIDEAIDYMREEAQENEEYRDPFFDSIYDTVSNLDLDLLNQMIGEGVSNKEEAQRVLGRYGVDDDVFHLRGKGELINDDFWHVRGEKSLEELRQVVKGRGDWNEEELKKTIIKGVTDHFNFSDDKAVYFAEKIVDRAKLGVDESIDPESEEYGEAVTEALDKLFEDMDIDLVNHVLGEYNPEEPSLEINDEFWDAYEEQFLKELDDKIADLEQSEDGIYNTQEELEQIVARELNLPKGKAKYLVRQILDDVKEQVGDLPVGSQEHKKEFYSRLKEAVHNLGDGYSEKVGERYKEDAQLVHGVFGNVSNDIWKVKGSPLIENMKTVVRKLQQGGKTIDELEEEIYNTLEMDLDLEEAKLKLVVKSIMDNAATSIAGDKFQENMDELMGDISKDMDDLGLQNELAKKDAQIERMRQLIDKMKIELLSGKEVNEAVARETKRAFKEEGDTLDYKEMKDELKVSLEEAADAIIGEEVKIDDENTLEIKTQNEAKLALKLRATEVALRKAKREALRKNDGNEKQEQRHRDQLKGQQDRISYLEKRVNELISQKQGDAIERGYKDQIVKLQLENKSLNSSLEMANKRAANITANASKTKEDTLKKSKFEMDRMRENYTDMAEKMGKYKLENQQLGAKVKALENSLGAVQNSTQREKDIAAKRVEQAQDGLNEKNKEIAKLKHNLSMGANEKKALEIKINDLQGKVKTLMTQSTTKGAGAQAAAKNVKSENEGKLELRVKQLEHVNDKLATQTNKLAADLAAAKKEVVKFKSEAMTIKNKNKELERKLKNR